MHILGYYVNWKSKTFNDALSVFKKVRIQRAKDIFEKLKNLNIDLEPEGLISGVGDKVIGRLHFAKAMLEKNYVSSISE